MKKVLVILLLIFGANACKKKAFVQDTRSFYMAVTPWPPDFTKIGEQKAYDFINSKCDMVCFHFDDGVPWQEALDNAAWPKNVQENITIKLQKNKGRAVFLSLAPLAISRKDKAGYWSDSAQGSVKDYWNALSFDDSLVSTAYFNYCCRLIDTFQPIYLNYAVEANSREWTPEAFAKFLVFLKRVYTQLKMKYPQLPAFASYMCGLEDAFVDNAKQLNAVSDYVALSSYAYSAISSANYGSTEVINLPKNWYSKFRDIAPEKPFAIAETGYIAEDLLIPEYGVTKKGDPKWQADFIQHLFETCNTYDAEFVNYFCAYDYDNAYSTMQAIGLATPLFKLWKDIGLYDGNGMKRPSLAVWEKWYTATKSQ